MTSIQVVAYLRVSTGKQEKSGLGLEAQKHYIETAAAQHGWTIVATYTDAVSGKVAPEDRPQMARAMADAKAQGACILVAKLDRLGRDVEHIARLMKTHNIKVATMPQADNFQLHLFAALAEQEREFISQRTKDALSRLQARADGGCVESIAKVKRRADNARKSGLARLAKAGKDCSILEQDVMKDDVKSDPTTPKGKVERHQKDIAPHVKACLYEGASTLQAVADCLNSRGKTTSRGGEWNPTTVRRLMIALDISFAKAA